MADEDTRSDAEWYGEVVGKSDAAERYFKNHQGYGQILEVLGFQYRLLTHAAWLRIRYKGEETVDFLGDEPQTFHFDINPPRRVSMAYTSYVKNFFRLWSVHKSVLGGMPYTHHMFRVVGESVMGQYYIACYAKKFNEKTDRFIACVEDGLSSTKKDLADILQSCHHKNLQIPAWCLRKELYTAPKASHIAKAYSAWSAEDVHFNPRVWRDEDPEETPYDMFAFLSFSVHNVVSFVESYKTVDSDYVLGTVGPFIEKFRYVLTDSEPDLIPDIPKHDFLWSLAPE